MNAFSLYSFRALYYYWRHNFDWKMDYIPLESMVKATGVILKIVELYSSEADKKFE